MSLFGSERLELAGIHEHIVSSHPARERKGCDESVSPGTLFQVLVATSVALYLTWGANGLKAQTAVQPPITGGIAPWSLVVNPATNKVYVIDKNTTNSSLLIFDGATHAIINKSLNLPNGASNSIAVNPATNLIYVANTTAGKVTVIDGRTDTVVGAVSGITGAGPVVVNSAANKIYVPNMGTNSTSISVFDGSTCTAQNPTCTATTINGLGRNPVAAGVNPVDGKVYVTNSTGNSLSIIDANNSVTNLAGVGTTPIAVQVNPVTNRIYVLSQGNGTGNGTVTVVDGSTGTVLSPQITVGVSPVAIGVNPVTNMIYVANRGSVTAINGASNAITTVNLSSPVNPPYASSVSVNSITNKIYVSYGFGGSQAYIGVIDGATNTLTSLSPVQVGNCPNGSAVNPVTNRTYVANTGVDCGGGPANVSSIDDSLNVAGPTSAAVGSGVGALVLNPVTNTLYAANSAGVTAVNGANLGAPPTPIALPSGGFAAAVDSVKNRVYVVNNNNSLQVVDAESGNAITAVTVGTAPQGVAVNAATSKIYVTNSGSASMTVVDGATNSVNATVSVGNNPVAVAVNPTTNRIYVANYNDGTVSIVDGLSKTVLATATVGTHPHDIQINPQTNFIYVANQGGGASGISVINGATNAVTQLASPSGAIPWAVAVDTGTNEIYVLNHQTAGSVTVVLGATSTTAAKLATTLPSGATLTGGTVSLGANTTPNSIAINPLTHRIYIASAGTNGLLYIDGPTGAAVKGPTGIGGMAYVAVNTMTNLVYLVSPGGQLYVVSPDAALGSLAPFPLTTTIAGDASDPLKISSGTATTPYQTYNPSPVINVTVNSTFTSSTTYNSIGYATNPSPTVVYYTIDSGGPLAVAVTPSAPPLPNPGVFSLPLPPQTPGLHTLYVYPAYGADGGSANSGSGTARGNMPEIGNLASYAFQIATIPTTTTVISDINPQLPSTSITFTAMVAPSAIGSTGPTGTVTFYDNTNPGSPILLGTGTVALVGGSYEAAVATSALATNGDHQILAVYSGDANYMSSSGTMTESINATLNRLVAVGGSSQTIPYGSDYSTLTPFTVQLQTSGGTPITTPTLVTFTAPAGMTLSALSCTTNASGQCSVSVATIPGGANVYEITAAATGSTNAVFLVTVTKVALTVTATDTSRVYAAVNPALAYSITGLVSGDSASVITGTPSVSTTANQNSQVGAYPISVALGTLAAANYTFNFVDGTLTVAQATPATGSATVLTVAPSTVMYGDTSVLTASVSPDGATGTVSFTATPTAGGTAISLGSSSLNDEGTAVLSESTLAAGTYNIAAHYNGDPNISANTSNTVVLTVTKRTAPGGGAALAVTVNDASRTTTEANPVFSYVVSGALVNNDSYATAVTGTPTYATAAGTIPGTFAITVTGLDSANYVVAFLPGTLTVVPTGTTTTLTASPNAPEYGDPVTLTATVAPNGATGTVSFYDGTIYLGNGNVSGGVATLTTSTLNAGSHTVTSIYNGDATYSSSISNPVTVTVAKKTGPGPGGAALIVTVQNESRTYGTADPQFVYEVSGTLVNNDTYATAVTGVPAYSVADLPTSPVGSTFPINISGLSSNNYVVAFIPGALTITLAPTTTIMGASATTTEYGDPLTLIAMVTPVGATGTIVFSNGSTVLGSGTVDAGGFVMLTTSSLNAGIYTITATYLGDNNYGNSTSFPVTVTVNKKTGSGPNGAALTVTVADATRSYGQGNPAFTSSVSGTLVNGDTYQTAVTGVPVFATTGTVLSPAGTYPISITGGLNSNNYVVAFVNGTLTVNPGTAVLTVASSQNPSSYGTPVTFTASISAGTSGTITFLDGTTVLGTAQIINDAATLTTSSLGLGAHPITASFPGDANYAAITSAVLNQAVKGTLTVTANNQQRTYGSVNPPLTTTITGFIGSDTAAVVSGAAAVTTTATSTSNVGNYPIVPTLGTLSAANYTFVFLNGTLAVVPATPTVVLNPVTPDAAGNAILTATVPAAATGTVTFMQGTTVIGTAPVINGVATLSTSILVPGTYAITAVYSGDTNFTTGTSNRVVVVITEDFAVVAKTPSAIIPPGAAAVYNLAVNPVGPVFASLVTLSATGGPAGATYTFNVRTVTPGTTGAPFTLTVQTVGGLNAQNHSRRSSTILSILVIPFAFVFTKRRRRIGLVLWLAVIGVILGSATGCGVGGYFSQPEATYTITVTGTSGNLQRSATVTLTVE